MSNVFGNYLKKLRSDRQLTLRAFCDANGFDAGNYSKIERGLLSPPRDDKKLDVYRQSFGLRRDGQEWQELQRLACISRGEIPAKLLSDGGMIEKLPALFRTLESGCISAEDLDKLIATLEGR